MLNENCCNLNFHFKSMYYLCIQSKKGNPTQYLKKGNFEFWIWNLVWIFIAGFVKIQYFVSGFNPLKSRCSGVRQSILFKVHKRRWYALNVVWTISDGMVFSLRAAENWTHFYERIFSIDFFLQLYFNSVLKKYFLFMLLFNWISI